ncbi:MAG: DUF3794 domain-containing protein [Oscillospiraceae bacterium]|nr:DUF3794 domain-containing protein [Oscillospiraceae bacterium]
MKPIYDNAVSKEETLELVVPDVSADIGKILDVRGQLLVSSQKIRPDEIYFSASVEVSVIYAAEDSGKVQCVMSSIPIEMTIPVPGADENSRLVSRWELRCVDARMLNPRKLMLRAEACAYIVVYVPDKFVLWDNLSEGDRDSVYILRKEAEHTLVVGVKEKSFVVTDEHKLHADRVQGSKMLSAETEICVQDAKEVGNKIIIKAVAKTNAIFMDETDGSLFDDLFTTQFSQIIEVDTYGDNIMNSVNILLKDAEFTMSSNRENGTVCQTSLQMVAQAVSREMKLSSYVADAYSNAFNLNLETEDIRLTKSLPQSPLAMKMRCKIKAGADLTEIMYAAVSEICTEIEGSTIRASARVSGVGKSDCGDMEAVEMKLSGEETVDLMRNQKLNILAVCCEKPMISGFPNNAELSLDIEITYCIRESFEICAVCAIEICEDCPINSCERPTLVVLCSEKETDLWKLAKKYGSTMEMIENANKMDREFSPEFRPLLIPRAR